MWRSNRVERLSNLVFISVNKDFLKKAKVEQGVDSFYHKEIDEIAKKKQIELIYK